MDSNGITTHMLTNTFQINAVDDATFYTTMGWQPVSAVNPVVIGDWKSFEQRELDDAAIEVLDNIVQICRENNIEVIFYTAPFASWGYPYFNAMEEYAIRNKCTYINLFDKIQDIGIDGNTDFFDSSHLNVSGATKVANYLGKYIVNHYDVTDFRQYEGNIWQQNLN